MNLSFFSVSFLAGCLAWPNPFTQDQKAGEKPIFAVELKTEKNVVAVNENIRITVSIRNQSGKEIYAIGGLDGSDVGWRWPVFEVKMTDAAGQEVAFERVGRCGNLNSLRRDDFIKLKPGAAFDPFDGHQGFFGHIRLRNLSLAKPGVYKITVTYDTRLATPAQQKRLYGDQDPSPELQALVQQVPEGVFTSEPLKIEVQ